MPPNDELELTEEEELEELEQSQADLDREAREEERRWRVRLEKAESQLDELRRTTAAAVKALQRRLEDQNQRVIELEELAKDLSKEIEALKAQPAPKETTAETQHPKPKQKKTGRYSLW